MKLPAFLASPLISAHVLQGRLASAREMSVKSVPHHLPRAFRQHHLQTQLAFANARPAPLAMGTAPAVMII